MQVASPSDLRKYALAFSATSLGLSLLSLPRFLAVALTFFSQIGTVFGSAVTYMTYQVQQIAYLAVGVSGFVLRKERSLGHNIIRESQLDLVVYSSNSLVAFRLGLRRST